MKVFTYTEARANLSELLKLAQREEVEIRRRDGSAFLVIPKPPSETSPFDVEGISTRASTRDILDAIRESRERRT